MKDRILDKWGLEEEITVKNLRHLTGEGKKPRIRQILL